jgi:uncharacterized protein with FMN-binding domain
MAVTNNGNRVIMTAAADAVTGKLKLRAAILDHTAAANCVLQDTGSRQIASFRTTASALTVQIVFPENFQVDGIMASTLSAGAVTLILG